MGDHPVRRATGVLLVAAASLAALAACTSDPVSVVATHRPLASERAAPQVRPTTAPPTQRAADATPVDVACKHLVPKKAVRRLSHDLSAVQPFVPAAGSPVARLGALAGTTCAWTDDAGDRLEVAVAEPSEHDATALKDDLVDRSNSVPTYRGEAYFQVVDHVGEVDAFRGRTWILARSNRFYEPGDAAGVVAAVDRALGTAPPSPRTTLPPMPTASPTASDAPSAPSPTPTRTRVVH